METLEEKYTNEAKDLLRSLTIYPARRYPHDFASYKAVDVIEVVATLLKDRASLASSVGGAQAERIKSIGDKLFWSECCVGTGLECCRNCAETENPGYVQGEEYHNMQEAVADVDFLYNLLLRSQSTPAPALRGEGAEYEVGSRFWSVLQPGSVCVITAITDHMVDWECPGGWQAAINRQEFNGYLAAGTWKVAPAQSGTALPVGEGVAELLQEALADQTSICADLQLVLESVKQGGSHGQESIRPVERRLAVRQTIVDALAAALRSTVPVARPADADGAHLRSLWAKWREAEAAYQSTTWVTSDPDSGAAYAAAYSAGTNAWNKLAEAFSTGFLSSEQRGGDGQWVSVDEHLPEVGANILVGAPNQLPQLAYLQDDNKGGQFFWFNNNGGYYYNPTHWQPLPPPPASLPTQDGAPTQQEGGDA